MDHQEMYTVLGRNLRCLRIINGLTQKEMAERLEISPPTLSRLERQLPTPRVSVLLLFRIQSRFGIPAGTLFDPNFPAAERSLV